MSVHSSTVVGGIVGVPVSVDVRKGGKGESLFGVDLEKGVKERVGDWWNRRDECRGIDWLRWASGEREGCGDEIGVVS